MSSPDSDARQAICFALDTSRSMHGEKLDGLNAGLAEMFKLAKANRDAWADIDVALVAFGAEVRTILEFSSLAQHDVPRLAACGATPMGAAVEQCLQMIERRQPAPHPQPAVLVIVADGRSTDDTMRAAQRCHAMSLANQLLVYPIAIGQDADGAGLEQFAPDARVKVTAPSAIADLFRELAQDITRSAKPKSVFDKAVISWSEAMRSNHQ